MNIETIKMVIQFRRASTKEWKLHQNVKPALGEPCFDYELNTLKIGDGVKTYAELEPIGTQGLLTLAADGKSIAIKDGVFRLMGFDAAKVGAQPFKGKDNSIEWIVPTVTIDELSGTVESLKTDLLSKVKGIEDDLSEAPITKKKGTITSPIVLTDLDSGCYSVSGPYQIGGKLTTTYVPFSNIIVLIDIDGEFKCITKIDGKRIIVYTVTLGTMEITPAEYATQYWVNKQGYTTENYVNQAIEDLYNKITLNTITKVSQLENDAEYLTAENLEEISNDNITDLF